MQQRQAVLQLFRDTYFPVGGPAGIMEVESVVFVRRQTKGMLHPRWVLEDDDLLRFADRMVDEMLSRFGGRILLNSVERGQAKYDIVCTILSESPSDGRDILIGLSSIITSAACRLSEAMPIASA